jgi:DNA-binding IclR family transcriptional regulator
VRALAAPVRDDAGAVVAAVSLAYLAELHERQGHGFLQAVIETADAISVEVGGETEAPDRLMLPVAPPR